MTQAFSRIEASKSAARVRVADAFKNEAGAFDLPSILVGVVVVGVLTAGVLASIFGVIPFAQDKAAQQDLGAITTAQGVYKAQVTEGNDYAASLTAIKAENLVGQDVDSVIVAGTSDEWAAASKSDSGAFFVVTSEDTTPVPATGATTLQDALDQVWQAAVADDPATADTNEAQPAGLK